VYVRVCGWGRGWGWVRHTNNGLGADTLSQKQQMRRAFYINFKYNLLLSLAAKQQQNKAATTTTRITNGKESHCRPRVGVRQRTTVE